MRTIITFGILLSSILSNAQYLETFSTSNKGILNGPCSGIYTTCASIDFAGVDWIISGDLSGIDTEGFYTQGGDLVTSDTDERACWESPTLDISSVATSSIHVIFTIPAGAEWESTSTVGSVDFMDVTYVVNGGTPTSVQNVSGCVSSGHTVCSIPPCSPLTGPLTYSIDVSGITGNELKIFVCLDTNSGDDFGRIESVSVPEAGTVLPVTWNNFSAVKQDENVILNWSTYEEINNMLFEIERSHDGRSFEKIAEVFAKTDASNETNYTFIDDAPLPNSVNYYRLKQVDYDGRSEYSEIRSINNSSSNKITIFPTMISEQLTIQATNSMSNAESIKIYSALGKLEKTILVDQFEKDLSIDCSMLISGRYWVIIVKKGGIVSEHKTTFVKI